MRASACAYVCMYILYMHYTIHACMHISMYKAHIHTWEGGVFVDSICFCFLVYIVYIFVYTHPCTPIQPDDFHFTGKSAMIYVAAALIS